jgi:hypothetical protein
MRAGLGSFDIGRLFFTLPPKPPFRPKSYVIGPIDTQFAADNRWLPPRADCFVDGDFFFSFWFRAPSLAELLNDPRTRAALPPVDGLEDVNSDDGFGQRPLSFFGEGSVVVPRDGAAVEIALTDEGGMPSLEEISVWPDSRYDRAIRMDIPVPRGPFPRLFLKGENSGERRKPFEEQNPALLAEFLRLLEEKLHHPPEGRPTRNTDGLEHWDEQDRTICYAFGFALLGRQDYYGEALRGVEASLALTHWGMKAAEEDKGGGAGAHSNLHWDNDMCQGATRVLAMIFFYDWCHDAIPGELMERIERKLLHHGGLIFRFSLAGLGNWASFPWSDHNTGTMHALQLIGFILGDKAPEAAFWHRWGRVFFEDWRSSGLYDSNTYYSPQRFNPIAAYIRHTKSLLEEDLAKTSDGVPDFIHKRLISCLSGRPDWTLHELYGCDAQSVFGAASLYRDGHAQWLAESLSRMPILGWCKAQGMRKVLELVHRDISVIPKPPSDLPRHFHDICSDSFWYRESWDSLTRRNPGNETLAVFENYQPFRGVDLGNPRTPRYDWGPLPFRGSFSLIRGRTTYVSKPLAGYVNSTRNANCMTADGRGQIGEGAWFPAPVSPSKLTKMEAPRVFIESSPAGERRAYSVRLDLSPAYDSAQKLSWVRTFSVWEEPLPGNSGRFDRLEILDEVTSDQPRRLLFYCHTQTPVEISGAAAVFKGGDGDLTLRLETDGAPPELAIAPTEYVTSYVPPVGEEPRHLSVRPSGAVKKLRLRWIFSFRRSDFSG